MNERDLAVIYARVSSKEQEEEGFSIPAQLKLLKDYAIKNNFEIVKEFVDIETAKKVGRSNFNSMLNFLKETPKAKHILCEKTDRLYRNFRDYVTIDELELTIHLVKENEVLSKNSRSHQKFIHGIKVLMAKNYIDNLSEETKKGMIEKATQGGFPGHAPLGYKNNTITKEVEVDENTAPTVKRMFQLYATGNYSLKRIANFVNQEGLQGKRGRKFRPGTVEKILKDPFY